ncbi:MAG: hypothetical protein Q4F60_03605, partial [Candidatus Saccharibacteria bacterium]|nr:hypothetical protein [Candidatus Saccharibacteria bacterium]
REEILQKAGAYSAVFFMAFFVALVSASAFTPVDKSEAATTEVNLTAGGYYLRVVSADTATMDLTTTAGGAMAIAKDTITINTNSPGYKVYLSMNSVSDTNLWKDGSSSSGYSIRTSDAPVEAPAALDTNRWGWALANPSASASTAIQNYGFDMTYCLSSGTCSDGNPGSLNKNNKFAGMPLSNNPALVAYSTTTATGATQDIYYGVNATTALESGSYTGRVVYTAVGEASLAAKGEMSFDVDN